MAHVGLLALGESAPLRDAYSSPKGPGRVCVYNVFAGAAAHERLRRFCSRKRLSFDGVFSLGRGVRELSPPLGD